jgi:opacity protein-like surface antigen
VGDLGNVLTWSAGARWYFTPNFAAGADYTSIDFDDSSITVDGFILSLRYDFGDRM